MKKCIIIGSGLGGLSCGVILANNGYEVIVLEQGSQIGGCLQCFQRDNVTFDTGMHYIGSAEKGQTLHTIMRYLGIDSRIELSRLDPLGYDVISLHGEHYRFANGKENFIDALAEHFPKSRDELNRYYNLVKLVASSSAMHSLNSEVDIDVNAEYKMQSVNKVLESIISSPYLQEVIAGMQPLYAGIKNQTPFSVHALIHDCFNQSAFRIVGGSNKVAIALADSIQQMGGRVIPNQQACKIECDEHHATAVITSDGERYPADLIISAIHPAQTLRMIDSSLIRPFYRKRIERASNTPSVFVVYLKFRKNSVRYMNHNLYYYRGNSTWGCEQYDITSWPKFLLYMHLCHTKNPVYAETGKLLTYMTFDELRQWFGTHVGQRGDGYEEFKRRKAELLIDSLEDEIPGIRYQIESYYTSTPLTYLDYTGIPEGSMYGMAKDVNSIGLKNISSKTSIPNLLLTGQSITSHGMFGVLAGSLITCSEVISKEEILRQLKH